MPGIKSRLPTCKPCAPALSSQSTLEKWDKGSEMGDMCTKDTQPKVLAVDTPADPSYQFLSTDFSPWGSLSARSWGGGGNAEQRAPPRQMS